MQDLDPGAVGRRSLLTGVVLAAAGIALPSGAAAAEAEAADALDRAMGKFAEASTAFAAGYPELGAPLTELDHAEGYRLFLRYLTIGIDRYIQYADPAFPAFYQATTDGVRKFAGDSPEQLYDASPISGQFDYVVSGNMHETELMEIGIYSGGLVSGSGARRLIDSMTERELTVEPNGDFEVRLVRSGGRAGELKLAPDASSIVVRRYLRDPVKDRPRPLAIRRTSGEAELTPLTPATLARGIEQASDFALWNVRTWAKWSARNRADPNKSNRLVGFEDTGDIYTPAGHRYLSGYWRVPEGKALLISFAPPPGIYWSFVPTNYWMESFEWRFGNRVFASSHVTPADAAGLVRMALAPADPGIAGVQWIETRGHHEGPMTMRIARYQGPMPTVSCELIDA